MSAPFRLWQGNEWQRNSFPVFIPLPFIPLPIPLTQFGGFLCDLHVLLRLIGGAVGGAGVLIETHP
jgi:hypothetical protein